MEASTKYPILMVHGMGYRDHKHLGYWGRIPKVLEANGARVYFSGPDSNGSVESNAKQYITIYSLVLFQRSIYIVEDFYLPTLSFFVYKYM